MANWHKLTEYFLKVPANVGRVALSFSDIETLVESKLPPSSSKRWFWANTYHRYYARFWMDAGWKVRSVRCSAVEFVREALERGSSLKYAQPKHKEYEAEKIAVSLTEHEFQSIVRLRTDQKAIEIVKKHLMSEYGSDIQIEGVGPGADLRVLFRAGRELEIEVKGTEKSDVAWSQLKVSSQASHDKLKSGVPIYRVTGVGSRSPAIYVLKYGRDFTLKTEPRWSVKPAHH